MSDKACAGAASERAEEEAAWQAEWSVYKARTPIPVNPIAISKQQFANIVEGTRAYWAKWGWDYYPPEQIRGWTNSEPDIEAMQLPPHTVKHAAIEGLKHWYDELSGSHPQVTYNDHGRSVQAWLFEVEGKPFTQAIEESSWYNGSHGDYYTTTTAAILRGHPASVQQLVDWLEDSHLTVHPMNVMPTQEQIYAHPATVFYEMDVARFRAAGLFIPEQQDDGYMASQCEAYNTVVTPEPVEANDELPT